MGSNMDKQNNHSNYHHEYIFQGAIIDSHGNEIEITDAMINRACDVLEETSKNFIPNRQNLQP